MLSYAVRAGRALGGPVGLLFTVREPAPAGGRRRGAPGLLRYSAPLLSSLMYANCARARRASCAGPRHDSAAPRLRTARQPRFTASRGSSRSAAFRFATARTPRASSPSPPGSLGNLAGGWAADWRGRRWRGGRSWSLVMLDAVLRALQHRVLPAASHLSPVLTSAGSSPRVDWWRTSVRSLLPSGARTRPRAIERGRFRPARE